MIQLFHFDICRNNGLEAMTQLFHSELSEKVENIVIPF